MEMSAIAASDLFSDVCVSSYPNRCGRPALTWDEMKNSIESFEKYDSINIFGGCCLAKLGPPPPDLVHCRITKLEYCMEMIAGNYTVSKLVSGGAYLVTPGWLEDWQRHISEWGFTQETAQDFFADCSRQIVLLDTAIRQDAADELRAYAEYVDRPFAIIQVGLDMLQLRMQLCLEQWHGERARQAEQRAQRQFSDYAMAFDLLSTLARSMDEGEVVQQTANLYQMLFAARDAAFIRFENELPVQVISVGFGKQADCEQLFREAAELEDDYCLLPSGDGFLLKMSHGRLTMGVVRIAGIAFPEYVETYLNLALATIGVCGLALHNARTFKDIADKSRELALAHAALQNTHMQLLQQEKMASIGQLAAGVAHEINNPMGFITSNLSTLGKYMARIREYLETVERCLADYTDGAKNEAVATRSHLKIDYVLEDSRQLITESLDGAMRVRNIVNDLKNLSRTDSHEMVRADVNKILESALNIASNEIKYVADIIRHIGETPEILCHPQQLSQVFINLLTNASHAIDGHGTITIRSWSDEESVCVSIADTGRGVPEDIRNRIFEPFFTTKDVGKGTGLGLSISYDILQKHGGEIRLESKTGHGSTFYVRLPLS
jgi:signal transduction histidine kinase